MTHVVFNPPPGWPPPPPGWIPPLGWHPPADWPAAPADWVLYLEEPTPDPAPAELRSPQATHESTWWGDSAGYHAAYYVSGPAKASEHRHDNAPRPSHTLRIPRPRRFGNGALARPGWPRRLLLALPVLGLLLLIVPLVNNPISRAISVCENAVIAEAARTTQPADAATAGEVTMPALDPGRAASYARSDLRYTLGANTNPDQVTILGNYFAPDGTWMTFTCTARHDPEPAQVLDLSVSPVGATPATSP